MCGRPTSLSMPSAFSSGRTLDRLKKADCMTMLMRPARPASLATREASMLYSWTWNVRQTQADQCYPLPHVLLGDLLLDEVGKVLLHVLEAGPGGVEDKGAVLGEGLVVVISTKSGHSERWAHLLDGLEKFRELEDVWVVVAGNVISSSDLGGQKYASKCWMKRTAISLESTPGRDGPGRRSSGGGRRNEDGTQSRRRICGQNRQSSPGRTWGSPRRSWRSPSCWLRRYRQLRYPRKCTGRYLGEGGGVTQTLPCHAEKKHRTRATFGGGIEFRAVGEVAVEDVVVDIDEVLGAGHGLLHVSKMQRKGVINLNRKHGNLFMVSLCIFLFP